MRPLINGQDNKFLANRIDRIIELKDRVNEPEVMREVLSEIVVALNVIRTHMTDI